MRLARELRRILPCAVLLWCALSTFSLTQPNLTSCPDPSFSQYVRGCSSSRTALLCSLVGRHLMGRLGGGDLGLVGLVRTGRLWCCHGPFQCDRAAFLAGVTGVGSLRPGDCECEVRPCMRPSPQLPPFMLSERGCGSAEVAERGRGRERGAASNAIRGAIQKLRIERLGFGTARQKKHALETRQIPNFSGVRAHVSTS
jgi:hypothetical protein